ncbi:MAG: transposase, partial [Clostridiales bacterium]|nr:transposase [Clostridiales bacterium]
DVRKEIAAACIISRQEAAGKAKNPLSIEIKTFKTLPDDLQHLKRWIEDHGCRGAAMESAGAYRRPICDALEAAFGGETSLLAANARHMRNIPGKKSDAEDAQRISRLLRAGLLKGGFIPEISMRGLRDPARCSKHTAEDICTQKNRIEKFLQRKGFKLPTFLTGIFGASGSSLPGILCKKGGAAPDDMRSELRGAAKRKAEDMPHALNGCPGRSGRQYLRRMLEMLDSPANRLKAVEAGIDEAASEFAPQIEPLQAIPGIGPTAAKAIIGEIGVDMSKFPAAAQFCPWAGLRPGENESAGKKKVRA